MSHVYCYGMISPSTVQVLRDDFACSKANTYAEVIRTHPSMGGEAANSAVILVKLGLSARLDGNRFHESRAGQVKRLLGGGRGRPLPLRRRVGVW